MESPVKNDQSVFSWLFHQLFLDFEVLFPGQMHFGVKFMYYMDKFQLILHPLIKT